MIELRGPGTQFFFSLRYLCLMSLEVFLSLGDLFGFGGKLICLLAEGRPFIGQCLAPLGQRGLQIRELFLFEGNLFFFLVKVG